MGSLLLEEMLRRKGTTLAKVKRWKKDPPWYTRLSWDTEAEQQDFKKWWLRTVMRGLRTTPRDAERAWLWWNFMYGLHPGWLDKK